MRKSKDEFFKESFNKPFDFQFTNKVAVVFDDMVHRSVPFYDEIQRMIAELAGDNYQEDSNAYDLGSFNRQFIKYYYDMKKRHDYSEMEIPQKREALENVLIPDKLSENVSLLSNAGCSHSDVFFKWYNFAGIIAKK
jgi:hypothetical protein